MSNYYPTLEKHSTSQRDQGPNGIRAGAAAGVADECALPSAKPAHFAGSRRGVHTSQHGNMPGGSCDQFCFFTESCCLALIRGKNFIKYLAHIWLK
jgi:hypothetical protein